MPLSINSSGVLSTQNTFDETQTLTYLLPPPGSLLFANTNIDGTVGNNFIQTADTTSLALANTDFTIEFWVNTYYIPAVDFSNYNLFHYKNTTVFNFEYYGYEVWLSKFSGTNWLYVTVNPGGAATSTIYDSTIDSTLLNKWVHMAYVRQNNYLQFYINGTGIWSPGQYSDSTFATRNQFTKAQMFIGSGRVTTAGRHNYPGYISNFRFVNGTAVYTSNFTPPTTRLTPIANTALLLNVSNSDGAFIDSSNNNFTLTAPNANVSFSTLYPLSDNTPTVNVAERLTNTNYQISGILDETQTLVSNFTQPYGTSIKITNSVSGSSTSNSNYLITTNTTSLSIGPTTDFTVECFVNFANTSLIFGLFSLVSNTSNISGNTYITAGGYPYGGSQYLVYSDSSVATGSGVPVTMKSNTWYHYALVRNSNSIYIYLDGTLLTHFSNFAPELNNNLNIPYGTLLIGSNLKDSTGLWGSIANFRVVIGTAIYTSAQTVYVNYFTPPSAPLTAITNTKALYLASSDSTVFTDSSTSGLTLTSSNNSNTVFSTNPAGPFYSPISVAKRIDKNGNLYVSGYLNEI